MQLLRDPRTAWMLGDVAMQNLPPVMRNDEETVQHSKRQSRHSEEVHRGDGFPMVAEKIRPSLCRLRAPRRSAHPAQDGAFRNIESEHRQLAVDAWSTPRRILGNQAEDELTQFQADLFPSRTNAMPRELGPIRFESGTMPSHHGLRLNRDQRLLPPTPELPQYYPEQSVSSSKSRMRMPSPQDHKLLPKD